MLPFLLFLLAVMTDWNDTLAPAFRKKVNFFVPCYFPAFPPYRQQELAADTCPVSQFTSPDQPILGMRANGECPHPSSREIFPSLI
jgi:hypothetical protein